MFLRIACVWAEALPIQIERARLGLGAADGRLLIPHPVERETVFACSTEAAQAGVEPGMPLQQARQRLAGARVVGPDEMAYHAAHGALQAALQNCSPAVETVGLGEFFVDTRGLGADDEDVAARLRSAATAASGLEVRVGLASGKFTAAQAARRAEMEGVSVVPAGAEAAFLAPLPVDALPHLPGELRRRLLLLDLHTLGDLAALKKAAVLRQFGPELSSLYELARGFDPRPVNPDVPPLRLVRSRSFLEPLRARANVLNVTARLCHQLSRALTAKGYHAEALQLAVLGDDGRVYEIGQALKPPTSDEARLTRSAAQLLGRLSLAAPVARVAVSVYPLRSWHLGLRQRALAEAQSGAGAQHTRLEATLHGLVHRFGEAVVRVAALLGPPLPLRVDVDLNDLGRPARLRYGGLARVVLAVDESWREERRWWERPVRRDYFRLQLADGSLRNVFQDLISGEWFLDRAWPLL